MNKFNQSDNPRTGTPTSSPNRTQIFQFLSPSPNRTQIFLSPGSTSSSRSSDSSDLDSSLPKCAKRSMIGIHPLSSFASVAVIHRLTRVSSWSIEEDDDQQRQHDEAKYYNKSAQGLEVILNIDKSLSFEESD
mmetsp:Transcript_6086/g.7732  ORF Transcript_6086/g.7732 Transcript_6086/m.7732 type:complete len:133 (-) Transcript_6086:151-549(-)